MIHHQSPTAQLWQYPLSSPSPRFTRINNYVRQLGWRFQALSPAVKSSWDAAGSTWPWLGYCLRDIYDFPEGGFLVQTGISVYNTVNCANLDLGRSITDAPPISATRWFGDYLFFSAGVGGTYLTWTGRPTPPSGTFYVDVRLWVGNSIPGFGPAVSKSVYLFSMPILYGVPTLLLADVIPPPPPSMAVYIYFVDVGEVGAGPFFGDRLGF
jgi:hypothetical protein